MDLTKYTAELDQEIMGQKEELIRKVILNELKSFKFDEKNISPNLLNALKMRDEQKIVVPLPEKKQMPIELQDSANDIASMGNLQTITDIYSDLAVGNNVYLYGVAGTGKTTLAKKIANILQRGYYQINCNQFTSPIDIKGGQTIEGYKQGELIKAWENGGLIVLDELPKIDVNTAGILNEALAQSADPLFSEYRIKKEDYDILIKQIDKAKAEDIELGMEVFNLNDKADYARYEKMQKDNNPDVEDLKKDGYVKVIFSTIIDGKGDKVRKHKNFCVIGTGNTNLKETSINFGGNNRQDYSLVDRFAGSFYLIGYDKELEKALTYTIVREICEIFRERVLNKEDVESVSLRTMLNFNRIYEQQMLVKLKSPYATKPFKKGNDYLVKKLKDSVDSFVATLPPAKQVLVAQTDIEKLAGIGAESMPKQEFIKEFIRIHSPRDADGKIIREVDPKVGQGKY